MTDKLTSLMAYILKKYPAAHNDDLSNARLTKLVYLADWKNALENDEQISGINWYFDNFGPFVNDVENAARENTELFEVQNKTNYYGSPKKVFSLKKNDTAITLSEKEKLAADHVIEVTKKLFWGDFIKLVYSTYPISSSERYSFLNLVEKARKYREVNAEASQQT